MAVYDDNSAATENPAPGCGSNGTAFPVGFIKLYNTVEET
jgi:hypothetical protein